MDRCLNNASSFTRGGTRYEECTNALMYAIAKDNMPLSVTERPGFRAFVRKVQPNYKLPSEPTLTKKLDGKHKELKLQIKQEIKDAPCLIRGVARCPTPCLSTV
ncbi:Zinc finger BED domain-containing protein RICESLEEPER 4 [Frankliniella fusca]|uniref:Zinc finger BED domain-containing protein RICESLEEPER 4 n=1 Tax=Frankliniella fusca TaxID=407009 RepID=A0AAE1LGU5_9NEOP|nr:Zinc finger BED domain-containing protein RICESLEEPER 4 [Frankliniella fusca]